MGICKEEINAVQIITEDKIRMCSFKGKYSEKSVENFALLRFKIGT